MVDIKYSTITIQQIYIFLTAAKYGNFTKAAEELHMSQSSVSRNILLLEENLRIILFVRFKQRVKLTPAGIYLAEAFMQPLGQIENILNKAYEIQACNYQMLKVCDVETTDPESYLFPVAELFEKQNPDVELSIARETPVHVIDHLIAGKYDAAFLPSVYTDSLEQAGLKVYKFLDLFPCFIISNRNSRFRQKDLCYQDLEDNTVVAIAGGKYSAYNDYVRRIMDLIGMKQSELKIVDNPVSVSTQLARGEYTAIMDTYYKPTGSDNIRYIEINDIPAFFGFVIAWSPDNRNPHIKQFIKCVKAADIKS